MSIDPSSARDARDPGRRFYLATVVCTTLLHVVLAAIIPLSSDEMYFWDTSRHLDWSYHDQPPLAAWTAIPFRMVLGEIGLAARGPAILASLLVALMLLPLVRRLGGGHREAAVAYLILHATPVFFLSAFYYSTDTLMVAAFLGAVWAAVAVAQGQRRAWWGFGVAVGIGFLAKFTVILVLPAIVAALVAPTARRDLKTPTPYLAAAASFAITAPVWIWGAQHNWDNITLALGGRHQSGGFTAKYLLEFVGAGLLLLTPFVAAALVIAWWRSRGRDAGWLVVRVAAATPVVFVLLVGIRTRVSPHWGLTGVVAAVALLVMIDFGWRRGLIISGAVMCLVLCSLVIGIVLFPEAAMGVEWSYRGRPTDVSTSKLADLIGNREIVREVEQRLDPGELVCSESFVWTHAVAFSSGGEIPTRLGRLRGGVAGLASLYWYEPEELAGMDCLWVTTKDDMRPKLRKVFEKVRPEPPIEIVRDGRTVRTVNLYRCRNLLDTGSFTRLPPAGPRDGR